MKSPAPWDAGSEVLRDNEDFNCGDEIQMVFTASADVLDFDVDLIVIPAAPRTGL